MIAPLVLAVEWRVADPRTIAADPELSAMPWAMLALLFPMALGVWTYEVTAEQVGEFKADLLRAVLAGTSVYVVIAIYGFFRLMYP